MPNGTPTGHTSVAGAATSRPVTVTWYVHRCPVCARVDGISGWPDRWPLKLIHHVENEHEWATEYYADEMKR